MSKKLNVERSRLAWLVVVALSVLAPRIGLAAGTVSLSYGIENGHAWLSSCYARDYFGAVTVAPQYEGLPVTVIGYRAFGRSTIETGGISAINLPSSITSIEKEAFIACPALQTINLPSGLPCIERLTFAYCGSLSSVAIPGSVTNIVEMAFLNSGLQSVVVPPNVSVMGQSAFGNCFVLRDAALLASVGGVPDGTFQNCTSLVSVALAEGIRGIGRSAFSRCERLADLALPGTLEGIGDWAFSYCVGLTSLIIPDSVQTIGGRAFEYCSGLSSVRIGEGVKKIDNYAFAGCSNLTSVTIPAAVDTLGGQLFQYCAALESVTVLGSGIAMANTFAECPSLRRVFFGGDAPRACDPYAFGGSTNVTVYYLAGTKGWGATLAGRPTVCVDYVPSEFGDGGRSIVIADFPKGRSSAVISGVIAGLPVVSVKAAAFSGCTNLTQVTLPGTVTNIGADAFASCPKLLGVFFDGDAPAYDGALFDEASEVTVYRRLGADGWGASFAGRPTALWFPPESIFPATFDAGGGTVEPASQTVTNGLTYGSLPTPVRPGYTFYGWYSEPAGAGSAVVSETFVTATAAHTLYAAWRANRYTVTFDAAGAGEQPAARQVTMGEAYGALPVPSRTNYVFGGWWTGPDGAGTQATETAPVSIAADHTLFAKWSGVASTVTFDAQGGSVSPPTRVVRYASPYGDLPVPVKAGFLFDGWSLADGSGVDAATVVVATSDHALLARWSQLPPAFTKRQPAAGTLTVSEGASAAFSATASDADDPNAATRGMSNITWYVDGAPGLETKTGAPNAITSAFTFKAAAGSVVGVAYREFKIKAVALDRQGGAAEAEWTVRVNNAPASQTITFKALPQKALGDADFPAGATASSGLPVDYASSNEGVAVVEAGVVRIAGAGTAVLTATQPGDFDFKAAASARQTLTVKARLTAEVPDGGGVVAGAGLYLPGTKVSLTARPAANHTFLRWEDGSQAATRSVIMPAENLAVTAMFGLTTNVPPPVVGNPGPQQAMVGLAFVLPLDIASDSLPTVAVTGLPAGLKYDPATTSIKGVPSSAVSNRVVTVTAKNVNKAPAAPQTFVMSVAPLPDWAWGAFSGTVQEATLGNGAASMTVTALGGVSGKLTLRGSNFTFSASGYAARDEAGAFWLAATAKVAKASIPLSLAVFEPEGPDGTGASPAALGLAAGALGPADAPSGEAALWRGVWKDAGMAAVATNYTGYYTATLPGDGTCGSGYLAFTVDKAGGVKTVGKLADGTVISLGGTLILDEQGRVWTVLYTAPTAYKGGCLVGVVEFARPAEGSVTVRPLGGDGAFQWQSFNPQATGEYGLGFERALSLAGGRYNTLLNLRDYYESGLVVGGVALPPVAAVTRFTDWNEEGTRKVTWNEPVPVDAAETSPEGLPLTVSPATGVGTGLTAPKADTPSKVVETGQYVYGDTTGDGLDNSAGLTLTFTRATGLFKGSFKAWYDYVSAEDYTTGNQTMGHLSKTMAFEGLLTPVRESGGAEGRGFYLWPEKATYANPFGTWLSYGFNTSYDFLLLLP